MDRNAPEIVVREWQSGNKNAIADLMCKSNFSEDRRVQLIFFVCSDLLLIPPYNPRVNDPIFPSKHHTQETFVAELTILVKKQQKVKLTVNEGWFSEEEMRVDPKWKPPCPHFFQALLHRLEI